MEKGLLKLPIDFRDYSHHETFGTLGATQLPTNDFTIYDSFEYVIVYGDTLSAIASRFGFSLQEILDANPSIVNSNKIYVGQNITIPARENMILNQFDLDFCTAFSTAEGQNAIFGVSIDPLYQFAKTKQIEGEYTQYGANLRDAVQSVVKYGSLPAKLAPYIYDGSSQDKTRDFLANWNNYPKNLDTFALQEKDLSFFALDGIYDAFDNIRSTLYMHLQERRAVIIGLFWHNEWTEASGGIIPATIPTATQGGGHAMAIVGQKTINGVMYLIFQQTWGPTAGNNGFYYFPRTVVDQLLSAGYGCYTFSRTDGSGMIGYAGFSNFVSGIFNAIGRIVGSIFKPQ